jgi:hypothetical protein
MEKRKYSVVVYLPNKYYHCDSNRFTNLNIQDFPCK